MREVYSSQEAFIRFMELRQANLGILQSFKSETGVSTSFRVFTYMFRRYLPPSW